MDAEEENIRKESHPPFLMKLGKVCNFYLVKMEENSDDPSHRGPVPPLTAGLEKMAGKSSRGFFNGGGGGTLSH